MSAPGRARPRRRRPGQGFGLPTALLRPEHVDDQRRLLGHGAGVVGIAAPWIARPADRLAHVLHPVRHGLLWFAGLAPPHPFAVYGTADMPGERFEAPSR